MRMGICGCMGVYVCIYVCGCVLCFLCFCAVAQIFAPQARLRGDPLYTAETQREMDLAFTKESTKWPGTSLERVPAPGGVAGGVEVEVKLAVGGHYGRGSASARANGLDMAKELPCPQANSLIEEIVEMNEPQWEALFGAIRAAIFKEFKEELNDDLTIPSKKYANVKDFLFGGKAGWRDFLFTSPEVHIQSVGRRAPASRRPASGGDPAADREASVALPEHYDGGRGFIVLAISLWTTRVIRMWLSDGTAVDMQTEPGHCYLANFIGVEHQVLHERGGGEAGRGHTSTSVLGKFEAVYFARSATFRHLKCANQRRLWQGVDGRLCECICRAYAAWEVTAAIELPSLADLRARRELQTNRLSKRRRTGKSRSELRAASGALCHGLDTTAIVAHSAVDRPELPEASAALWHGLDKQAT